MTHLPTDASMRAWRLAGRFVCQCNDPQPKLIGAFQSYECRTCFRPIFNHHQAVELIAAVLDAEAGAET